MLLKSYNQKLEDKTANKIYLNFSRKQVGSVNTEIDKRFKNFKNCSMFKDIFEKIFLNS